MLPIVVAAAEATLPWRWDSLGLDPVLFQWDWITVRWYSLAYIAGFVFGGWYLLKLIATAGAPLARRHVEDLAFSAMLGVIVGGRLGYVLFYRPDHYFSHPLEIVMVTNGGMSFHGGVVGVSCAILYVSWRKGLNWLRVHDYVACCVPFGLLFGRLANFVNGELWGRETSLPWGMIFPSGGEVPRHPSQLYEAALEGILLGLVLWFAFWKTPARFQPGKLVGIFVLGYGLARFFVELVRQPDEGLEHLAWGLSMGQTLTVPMIAGGLYLIATAKRRGESGAPAPNAS